MRLTILTVPDCPHATLLADRLAQALAGRAGVSITRTVITDAADAARHGMHGSPTTAAPRQALDRASQT